MSRHRATSYLLPVLVLAAGSVAAWLMRDISVDEVWKLLTALGAGTGAVFMLRWFWWRINAWSEIVAMVVSLVAFLVVGRFIETSEYRMSAVAGITIVAWLAATFLTAPERPETLERFYRKVRPGGRGGRPWPGRTPMSRRTAISGSPWRLHPGGDLASLRRIRLPNRGAS